MRALHFQYLGGLGPCAGSRRETVLRQAVLTILAGKDPAGSDPPTGRALGAPAPTSGDAGSERGTQFRRLYLALRIADQRRYYEARHQEYQAAHDQAVTVRNLLLLLAAVLAAIGQVVSESDRPPGRPLPRYWGRWRVW